MKFTARTKSLLKAASLAAQAISTRSTLPVLSCLKLEASPGGITIAGASMDNRIENRAPAEVETPGAICVDAAKFVAALTRSRSETVSVEIQDASLVMGMGSMRCRLSTISSEEFVLFASSQFKEVSALSSDALLKAISDLKSIAKPSDTRLFCQCLHLGKYDGKLAMVATNGHCALIRFLDGSLPENECLIPHSLAGLCGDGLKSNTGMAQITSNDRAVRLTLVDCVVTGQLMEGSYPDMKRIIDNMAFTTSTVIDRKQLIEACENCAIFSDDRFSSACLNLSSSQLLISCGSTQDSASDAVPASGGRASIKIHISYLISALKAFDSDTIRMEIGPASIRIQDDQTIFACCLMDGGAG